MLFWFGFMLVYRNMMNPCVHWLQLYILGGYSVIDFLKVAFSVLLLRNVVNRKNKILKEYKNSNNLRKMTVDLFEIRYLPIEFDMANHDDEELQLKSELI